MVPGIRQKIAELDKKSQNQSGKKLTIPINGKDIMSEFNIKAGPALGLIMDKVKSKVIENPDVTKEELFKYVEEYLKTVV
jgi:stalled ribosome rescue protein Dom34